MLKGPLPPCPTPARLASTRAGHLDAFCIVNHPTARDARAIQQHELDALFDQQAAGYDTQWARMAPIRESLHFLLETVFAGLPDDARLLCVGAGIGAEFAHLAPRFPGWRCPDLSVDLPSAGECRPTPRHECAALFVKQAAGYDT